MLGSKFIIEHNNTKFIVNQSLQALLASKLMSNADFAETVHALSTLLLALGKGSMDVLALCQCSLL